MKCKVVYENPKSQPFGTGEPTTAYVAHLHSQMNVTSEKNMITVEYHFTKKPIGMDYSEDAKSHIKKVELHFDERECVQLAVAILSHIHHPTTHSSESYWTGSELPVLNKNLPNDSVLLQIDWDSAWNMTVFAKNRSDAHIRQLGFKWEYSYTCSEGNGHDAIESTIQIDLPPNVEKQFNVDLLKLPEGRRGCSKGFQISVTSVSGFHSADLSVHLKNL